MNKMGMMKLLIFSVCLVLASSLISFKFGMGLSFGNTVGRQGFEKECNRELKLTSLKNAPLSRPSKNASGTIYVQALKLYQEDSFANIDIKVTNNSDYLVSYLLIDVEIYDAKRGPLGQKPIYAGVIRPRGSQATTLSFYSVDYRAIKSWQLNLVKISVNHKKGVDSKQDFELVGNSIIFQTF